MRKRILSLSVILSLWGWPGVKNHRSEKGVRSYKQAEQCLIRYPHFLLKRFERGNSRRGPLSQPSAETLWDRWKKWAWCGTVLRGFFFPSLYQPFLTTTKNLFYMCEFCSACRMCCGLWIPEWDHCFHIMSPTSLLIDFWLWGLFVLLLFARTLEISNNMPHHNLS